MPMGSAADYVKTFRKGFNSLSAAQKNTKTVNQAFGPCGDVQDSFFLNFTITAIGFAQQDAGWRISIGDGFDIHGHYITAQKQFVNKIITIYMGTKLRTALRFLPPF
jgi:hypothetical protein